MKKEDFITIFLVHFHLDVVPEVLLMVGLNFLTHTEISYIIVYDWITKKIFFLRRCSLSSVTWMLFSRIPLWLEIKVSFTKLVDNHYWKMPTNFQDDWFINSWEILTFRPLEKENKNKNFRKFKSFQVGFLGNNKPEIGRTIITIANILTIVIQTQKTKP